MSHKASHWLAEIPASHLNAGAFRVLFHLCDAHNAARDPETACFPSQEKLRRLTGLSNGGLNNALNAIEKAGFIRRNRSRNADGTHGPTYYILGCDEDVSHNPTPENGDGTVSTFDDEPSPLSGLHRLHSTGVYPVIEPVRLTSKAAPANKYDQLQEKLLTATGLDDFRSEKSPGLLNLSPIIGLLEAGYDLEKDILPVIRARCATGLKPRSWSYFVKSVQESGETRKAIAAQAKPKTPEIDWLERVGYFQKYDDWPHAWGPKPGEAGCRVPTELVELVKTKLPQTQPA